MTQYTYNDDLTGKIIHVSGMPTYRILFASAATGIHVEDIEGRQRWHTFTINGINSMIREGTYELR